MSADHFPPVAVSGPAVSATPAAARAPEEVVRDFFRNVRSGAHPDWAVRYFAPQVTAHQITSEGETAIVRTPADYTAHVREFLKLFGEFRLEVTETFAANDRVYVRWRQIGRHVASLDGEAPTGAPLVDVASAVYRVNNGLIEEYWIQSDRKGLEVQVERAIAQAKAGS